MRERERERERGERGERRERGERGERGREIVNLLLWRHTSVHKRYMVECFRRSQRRTTADQKRRDPFALGGYLETFSAVSLPLSLGRSLEDVRGAEHEALGRHDAVDGH